MTVAKLKVVRMNDFGAWLGAGTGNTDDDILLHKLQQTAEIKIGDVVEVFLYLDPKKRLTASMRVPKMKVGQIARLKVINVSEDGAFLEVGAERGIFMPFAEMIGKPKVGDIVWAKLYTDIGVRPFLRKIFKSATKLPAQFTTSRRRARSFSATNATLFLSTKKKFRAF